MILWRGCGRPATGLSLDPPYQPMHPPERPAEHILIIKGRFELSIHLAGDLFKGKSGTRGKLKESLDFSFRGKRSFLSDLLEDGLGETWVWRVCCSAEQGGS